MEGNADAMAGVSTLVQQIKERKWAETLRPIDSFVKPEHFRRPRNVAEMSNRVELNLAHFASNYLLVTLVIFTAAILTKPTLFFVFAVVGALWHYTLKTPEVRVGKVVLNDQQKLGAAGALSAAIIFLFAGTTLFMIIGFCVTVTLAHAAFHRTPDIVDDDNIVAMEMQTKAAPNAPSDEGQ